MVEKKRVRTCKLARDVIAKRQNLGLTQAQTVEQIGVGANALWRLFHGLKIRASTRKKITAWLGENPRQMKMFDAATNNELVVPKAETTLMTATLISAAIQVKFGIPVEETMNIIKMAESVAAGVSALK